MRSTTLICVLLLAKYGFSQNSLHIPVTIDGYTAGYVKLIGMYGDQNYIVDSFQIQGNGQVVLTKDTLLHQGLYYLLLPDYKNFSFLLDRHQSFSISTNRTSLIGNLKAQNNLCNKLYFESLQHQEKLDSLQKVIQKNPLHKAEAEALYDRINNLKTEHLDYCLKHYPDNFYTLFKKAGQNPVFVEMRKKNGDVDTFTQLQHYRMHFWENVDFSDNRLLRTPVITNKLRRFIKELTPQQPDSIIVQADYIIKKVLPYKDMFSFISNWIALQYQPTKTSVMDGEAVFVHIIDTYFDEKTADWFQPGELEKLKKKTSEMRASLLNKKGPNVVSNAPDGSKKSIYEITAPYIIVYMYTPNCEHCKAETPKLRQFYQEWKGQGVEVFAIVIETTYDDWLQYIEKNLISDWVNVYDPTNASIYAKYYVDVTPEMYVLNPERIIIGKNLNAGQLQTIIERDRKKRK